MTNQQFNSFDELIDFIKATSGDNETFMHIHSFLLKKNFISVLNTNLGEMDWNKIDAVVDLIRKCLPNARYGFDFNPAVKEKFNKEGVQTNAPGQGWVKIPAIDWSIANNIPGKAMTIALLFVLRDLEKMHEANVSKQGESV